MAGRYRQYRGKDDADESLVEPVDLMDAPLIPRPIDQISDRQYQDILRLARLGFTHKSMASWLGLSQQYFHDLLNSEPMLRASIDNERSRTVAGVSEVCLQLAMKGDIHAIKLFLTHVGKWTVNTEVTDNSTVNIQVNNLLGSVPIDKIASLLREAKTDNGAEESRA